MGVRGIGVADPMYPKEVCVASLYGDGVYQVPISIECLAQRWYRENPASPFYLRVNTLLRQVDIWHEATRHRVVSVAYESVMDAGVVYWLDSLPSVLAEYLRPAAPAPLVVEEERDLHAPLRRVRIRQWEPTEG